MAEDLSLVEGTREEMYQGLLPQISGLLQGEENLIANLGNIAAALKEQFNWLWVGFYLIDEHNPDELVLGPFQGPVACTRIKKGRGVCGSSWAQEKTLIVDDVNTFPGHIACSSLSRSEIVIPFYHKGRLAGVLDADSTKLADFNTTDQHHLETILKLLS